MNELILKYGRHDAKTVIKVAFKQTPGIKSYEDKGNRIIGKTGMGLMSYGELVTVQIPELQNSDDETRVHITSEKRVAFNLTSSPDKVEAQFLQSLNSIRGYDVDDILEVVSNNQIKTEKASSMLDETVNKLLVVLAVLFFGILFLGMLL